MSTYAIGDVQGCYDSLKKLLSHIEFDAEKDTLWFTGDLINRGPQSLDTLRFIKELDHKHKIVLGNHDLHLLAVAYETHASWEEDTLTDILNAPDRQELIDWLRHQPLIHHDATLGYTMVHAGLASSWDLTTALALSKEVEMILQSDQAGDFFKNMYGNFPDQWQPSLTGWDRLRCITNYFTRVRFCDETGRMNFQKKGKQAAHLIPWYEVPHRAHANLSIVFGHWAALNGITHMPHIHALDTGCVWGFSLTAMRLEDAVRFQIACPAPGVVCK
jgi:bis(5'-nucleosyl)-tetraphosphatase (symmetrical)